MATAVASCREQAWRWRRAAREGAGTTSRAWTEEMLPRVPPAAAFHAGAARHDGCHAELAPAGATSRPQPALLRNHPLAAHVVPARVLVLVGHAFHHIFRAPRPTAQPPQALQLRRCARLPRQPLLLLPHQLLLPGRWPAATVQPAAEGRRLALQQASRLRGGRRRRQSAAAAHCCWRQRPHQRVAAGQQPERFT